MTRLAWITFELSQTVTLRPGPLSTMKRSEGAARASNNLETDKKED